MIYSGRGFHSLGAANEKALSPKLGLTLGTYKIFLSDDLVAVVYVGYTCSPVERYSCSPRKIQLLP